MLVLVKGKYIAVARSDCVVVVIFPPNCSLETLLAIVPLLLRDEEVSELEERLNRSGRAL